MDCVGNSFLARDVRQNQDLHTYYTLYYILNMIYNIVYYISYYLMYYIIHLARPRPFHFSGFPSRTRRRAEKAVCGEASVALCFSILCSCQYNHGFEPLVRDQSIHVFQSYYVRLTNLRRFCSSALGAVTRTPSWFLHKGQNMCNTEMIHPIDHFFKIFI